jgi:hypothetical protein
MRYIIDIEPRKTSIEVEKINEKLCMVTIWQSEDCIELDINEQQLYDLIGALHLVQNQMKKK